MLKSLENSRGFLLVVLSSALLLLVMLATDLEHSLPTFNEISVGSPRFFTAPVDDFAELTGLTDERQLLGNAATQQVFKTGFFNPPPGPEKKPAPPAPTSREVQLVYLGLMETSAGERLAFVRQDETTRVLRVGGEIEPGHQVTSISTDELGVTGGGETNLTLRFQQPFQLRLPLKP